MTEELNASKHDDAWRDSELRQVFNRADSLAAWLLATLVTINTSGTGAALALQANKEAAIAFASGIILAVLSGMTSWGEAYNRGAALTLERLISEFRHIRSYAAISEAMNFKDGEILPPEFTDRSARIQFLFKSAFLLNLLSLAAFAVGCILATGAI
jgi:hypothetical protein